MKRFIFLALLFITSSANASYQWYINNMPARGMFSSASAACTDYISQLNNVTYDRLDYVNRDMFVCYGKNKNGGSESSAIVADSDTCDAGTTFNNTTGACDSSNKCEAVKGASTTYSVKSSSSGAPPTSVVVNGCAASFSGVMACGNNTKGSYICTGKLTFSGEQGTSTPNVTAFDCSNVDCSKEKIQGSSSSTPCNYTTSGNTSTCTSSSSSSTPGTTTGKQGADGKYTFTENPTATSTETKVTTTVVTTATGSGGSTTVKTDDASVTKCVGASGACTTKTGTTTSSSTTGSDGVSKDGGSSCVGETCQGEEGGTAGTFTGIQPCDDCSWEKSGVLAESMKKQFGPTDVDGKAIGTGTYVTQTYDRFNKTPIMAAISSIKGPEGSGSCPMTRAELFGTSIGFDAICTLMPNIRDIIAPVMYAVWSIVAVIIFLSA